MTELIEHEARKRELFFKRIKYMVFLSDDRKFTIKEIHMELGINDRQVSRELKELESYGLVELRSEGKHVFVSNTSMGLKILQALHHDIDDRPIDLDRRFHDKINSFIDKYKKANNDDTKRMALKKVNDTFWDIRRGEAGIVWEKETEIIAFINEVLNDIDNLERRSVPKVYEILTVMVNSGYYNKDTLNIIRRIVKQANVEDDPDHQISYMFNYVISICIIWLVQKPEYKDQVYPVLIASLKKIKNEDEIHYQVIQNSRDNLRMLPEDIKESLLNEMFQLINDKERDKEYRIIERLIDIL